MLYLLCSEQQTLHFQLIKVKMKTDFPNTRKALK